MKNKYIKRVTLKATSLRKRILSHKIMGSTNLSRIGRNLRVAPTDTNYKGEFLGRLDHQHETD